MKKIGGYLIIKKTELPALNKAVILARTLTENDIELILAGKCHIHRNPVKRKVAETHAPAGVLGGEDSRYPQE